MGNRREPNMDKYDIDKYKYRELLNFCRQYNEKKDRIRDVRSLSVFPPSGMPQSHSAGNPTERKALAAVRMAEDCELIEQTAIEADSGVYSWLIKNVTEENLPWEILDPPIGRRQFYESRRRFFYLLALKKGMI